MSNDVLAQLAALSTLTTPQLREKWKDLNGSEAPAYNRTFLIKRLSTLSRNWRSAGFPPKPSTRLMI